MKEGRNNRQTKELREKAGTFQIMMSTNKASKKEEEQ